MSSVDGSCSVCVPHSCAGGRLSAVSWFSVSLKGALSSIYSVCFKPDLSPLCAVFSLVFPPGQLHLPCDTLLVTCDDSSLVSCRPLTLTKSLFYV